MRAKTAVPHFFPEAAPAGPGQQEANDIHKLIQSGAVTSLKPRMHWGNLGKLYYIYTIWQMAP